MSTANDTATAMSSVTDPDGFTTVSCHGCMSSPSPPKQRPQSCSPPRQGNEIKRVNLFDDKFLSSFLPSSWYAMDTVMTIETKAAINAGIKKNHQEPRKRGSPCKNFPPTFMGKLGDPNDVRKVAFLSGTPLAGTGCDGPSCQNIPQGCMTRCTTKDPNDFSSLPLSLAPPSLFPPISGDGCNLDAYICDPSSRQPTKKSFRGFHASLVTAALLTSSSASPARISIYTNKRSALASPAKGGTSLHKCVGMISPAPIEEVFKEAEHDYSDFDRSLDEQELLRESDRVARRLLMKPIDLLFSKEEKVHATKENARASRIALRQEHFKNAAGKKINHSRATSSYVDLPTASTHSHDNSDDEELDNECIYGKEYDDTNEDFSYHSSDGLDENDAGYDHPLGNGIEGTSPPATAYSKDVQVLLGGHVEDLPNWLHEMDANQNYDASHLLAAPITRSMLRQRQCQPVSWKVHGRQKGGEAKPSFPTRYLQLNSSNSGRGTEGTHMFCFSPSNFVRTKLPRTSLFCNKASANQPIQVKSTMVSASSNEVNIAPRMVGTGPKNAAKGSGMSGGKRAGSLSPLKPRISANLDGR